MKTWHVVLVAVIAYVIGAIYPGPVAGLKSKIAG